MATKVLFLLLLVCSLELHVVATAIKRSHPLKTKLERKVTAEEHVPESAVPVQSLEKPSEFLTLLERFEDKPADQLKEIEKTLAAIKAKVADADVKKHPTEQEDVDAVASIFEQSRIMESLAWDNNKDISDPVSLCTQETAVSKEAYSTIIADAKAIIESQKDDCPAELAAKADRIMKILDNVISDGKVTADECKLLSALEYGNADEGTTPLEPVSESPEESAATPSTPSSPASPPAPPADEGEADGAADETPVATTPAPVTPPRLLEKDATQKSTSTATVSAYKTRAFNPGPHRGNLADALEHIAAVREVDQLVHPDRAAEADNFDALLQTLSTRRHHRHHHHHHHAHAHLSAQDNDDVGNSNSNSNSDATADRERPLTDSNPTEHAARFAATKAKLGIGAIIGISIGVVVGVALIGYGVYRCFSGRANGIRYPLKELTPPGVLPEVPQESGICWRYSCWRHVRRTWENLQPTAGVGMPANGIMLGVARDTNGVWYGAGSSDSDASVFPHFPAAVSVPSAALALAGIAMTAATTAQATLAAGLPGGTAIIVGQTGVTLAGCGPGYDGSWTVTGWAVGALQVDIELYAIGGVAVPAAPGVAGTIVVYNNMISRTAAVPAVGAAAPYNAAIVINMGGGACTAPAAVMGAAAMGLCVCNVPGGHGISVGQHITIAGAAAGGVSWNNQFVVSAVTALTVSFPNAFFNSPAVARLLPSPLVAAGGGGIPSITVVQDLVNVAAEWWSNGAALGQAYLQNYWTAGANGPWSTTPGILAGITGCVVAGASVRLTLAALPHGLSLGNVITIAGLGGGLNGNRLITNAPNAGAHAGTISFALPGGGACPVGAFPPGATLTAAHVEDSVAPAVAVNAVRVRAYWAALAGGQWAPQIADDQGRVLENGYLPVGNCAGTKLAAHARWRIAPAVHLTCLSEAWYASAMGAAQVLIQQYTNPGIASVKSPNQMLNVAGYPDGGTIPSCSTCQMIIPEMI